MAAPTSVVDIAVFWDYENVRVPKEVKASAVMSRVWKVLLPHGQIIVQNLYYDSQKRTERATDRVNLDLTGWHLVDCPTRNSKETLDKKLIVDVMHFAWDHTSRRIPCCVVLITSDGDYAYALAKIRNLGVKTIVFHGEATTTAGVLLDTCEVAMSWVHEVLRTDDDDDDDDDCAEEDDDEDSREAASPAGVDDIIDDDIAAEDDLDDDEGRRPYGSDGSTARVPLAAEALTEEEEEEHDPTATGTRRRKPRPRRPEAALEQSIGDALAGRHLIFLHSLNEARQVVGRWANDSLVAISFHRKRGRTEPSVYADVRLSAIRGGFVEFGRKELATGKVLPVAFGQHDAAQRYSSNCLLRLTHYGHMQLDNPETAATAVIRDHNNSSTAASSSRTATTSSATTGSSSGCVPASKPSRKGELCRNFPKCARGDKCPFAHGLSQLSRPLVVPCRFWNGREGSCKRGAECAFSHSASSPPASIASPPPSERGRN